MKRFLRMAAVLVMAFAMTACGGKTAGADAVSVGTQVMKAATGFPEMKTITSEDKDAEIDFTTLCDFSYDKVSSYFYAYASDGTAPEVAVVTLKNPDDTADLMRSIKDHVTTREGTMQEYSPDQVEMVRSYLLSQQNGTVGLFIGKGSAALEKSFRAALK